MRTQTRKKNTQSEAPPERTTVEKGKTSKVGNLCGDPELRFSGTGTAFARTRLAVEEPLVPGDWAGERATTFYDLTVFGPMAENFAACCTKGMRVVVMGRAQLETWHDPEKGEQTAKKILADAIGPDLRWATASVEKVKRTGPAEGGNTPPYDGEEPF